MYDGLHVYLLESRCRSTSVLGFVFDVDHFLAYAGWIRQAKGLSNASKLKQNRLLRRYLEAEPLEVWSVYVLDLRDLGGHVEHHILG